ncbi:MAG: hypothetical protein GF401_13875 [Chitinivibrionales bacterium]|nr:hypothetical protein [Chitinivibrionales bacterium]
MVQNNHFLLDGDTFIMIYRASILTAFFFCCIFLAVPGTASGEWYPQSLSSSDSTQFKNLHTVFFVDTLRGWVGGDSGMLYMTTDGGASWQKNERDSTWNFRKIQFINHTTGWIAGLQDTILYTSKSGEDWEILTSGNHGGHRGFDDIFFLNERQGWAVGGAPGYYRKIMYSSDAGVKWEFQESYVVYRVNAVFFIDSTTGWIAGGNKNTSGFPINSPLIKNTTDGGIVWDTRMPLHSLSGKGHLYDIFFTDSLHGWAVGDSGMILYSSNGGMSWEQQNSSLDNTLFSIFCPDTAVVYIVGEEGAILYSTDGGELWSVDSNTTGHTLRDVFFVDEVHGYGWIVGDSGTLLSNYKTGDSPISGRKPSRFAPGNDFTLKAEANPRFIVLYGEAPSAGSVTVRVVNAAGRELLHKEFLIESPGRFTRMVEGFRSVQWPSGIYFCCSHFCNAGGSTRKISPIFLGAASSE